MSTHTGLQSYTGAAAMGNCFFTVPKLPQEMLTEASSQNKKQPRYFGRETVEASERRFI